MPYVHKSCGGTIKWVPPLPVPPRCEKCKKKWGLWVIYSPIPPRDMSFLPPMRFPQAKRPVSYARWANRIPGAGAFASRLPNWPRWARLLVVCLLVAIPIVVYILVWGL